MAAGYVLHEPAAITRVMPSPPILIDIPIDVGPRSDVVEEIVGASEYAPGGVVGVGVMGALEGMLIKSEATVRDPPVSVLTAEQLAHEAVLFHERTCIAAQPGFGYGR